MVTDLALCHSDGKSTNVFKGTSYAKSYTYYWDVGVTHVKNNGFISYLILTPQINPTLVIEILSS